MERLRQRGKNQTKSNVNRTMRTYLLCMKKGVSSIYEKIIRTQNNHLRNFIHLGRLIKTTTWPKILKCR